MIFNIAGLVILLAGFGSIYVLAFLSRKSEWNPLYLMVLVWIGMDLLYRASFPEFRFFDPDQGGHIFYVPLWVLGVALAVYSKLEDSKLKRRALNRQPDSTHDKKETAAALNPKPADPRPDAKSPQTPRARPAYVSAVKMQRPRYESRERKVPGWSDNLPRPRWAMAKGPTVAVSQAGERIIVTQASDVKRLLRAYDLDEPEKSNLIDVSLQVFDAVTGAVESLPPLTCADDAGQCFLLDDALHVNSGSSIARWDSAKSGWRNVVGEPNYELQSPAVIMAGWLYALWRVSGENSKAEGFRFSKTSKKGTVWGPCFGPAGYRASWETYKGGLYVRCQVAGRGAPENPTLFRLGSESLKVEAEVAPGTTGQLLVANGQLFCDGLIDFGELAIPTRRQEVKQASEPDPSKWAIAGPISMYLPSQAFFLSCYDLTLSLCKRWRIWNEAKSLAIAPEGKGILITHSGKEGAVRLLSSRTPDPMLVGSRNGLLVSGPVNLGRHVFWLYHLGATGDYYTLHDWWPREQTRTSSEQSAVVTTVEWFDEKSQKWRRATPRNEYDPTYLLKVLDTRKGKWSARELVLSEPIYSILANDNDLIFVGWSEILSLPVNSVLEGCESSGKIPRILGDACEPSAPIVQGLPLSGPITDDWGFRSASSVNLEVLKNVYTPADFARIEKDSDLRSRVLDDQLTRTVDGVNASWPDVGQLARKRCPPNLLSFYSRNIENVERTPFGALALETSVVSSVVDWCRAVDKEARAKLPEQRAALLVARFLLHEYIRRLKNGVWQDYEKPEAEVPRNGPYQELLGWYNLGSPGPKSNRDNRITHLMRGAFGRGSAPKEETLTSLDILRLVETWPGGCPPLIQDIEGRLAYLRHCVDAVPFIVPQKRSRLQAAVARSWENALVRNSKLVFISYSHSTAEPAQLIADGLRNRGIGVALDVHELPSNAEEWAVETWIAENILACDVIIYIASTNFVTSGWINRETEWEHCLYGVKRAVILPYFVVTDRQLELRGYPRSRICDATDVKIHAQSGRVVDELATRISYDLMHTYLSDRKPIAHSAF